MARVCIVFVVQLNPVFRTVSLWQELYVGLEWLSECIAVPLLSRIRFARAFRAFITPDLTWNLLRNDERCRARENSFHTATSCRVGDKLAIGLLEAQTKKTFLQLWAAQCG